MDEAGSGRDALSDYRSKRDFSVTPEPSGEAAEGESVPVRRFVVQRHRARRLHYDFRLEVDGVLASWAVPKGPSMDPSVRSLAVHVEDHPIEYREFEGVIPGGEYGRGDVIVWDRGTWVPGRGEDPAQAIADGELHFDVAGEKLKGRFVLVRTKDDGRGKDQWLMLHKRDDDAIPGWNPEDYPLSVRSGRTNDEVAASPEATWHSELPPDRAEVPVRRRRPQETHWSEPTPSELQNLGSMGEQGSWEFQGEELRLTNLEKELFPAREDARPVTKRDLVRYFSIVAPMMLPYLIDRPVNLHRFPNGADKPGFWHKAVPAHAPAWLTRWHNTEADRGESEYYFVVDSPPAVAWMANYGAIELHAWTSRIPNVREPTWAYIDIDPGTETSFDEVVLIARLFRDGLEHLGVLGLPKVTGQRGLHIWIPIQPGYSFEQTRTWTEKLSRAVGATVPDLVSWEWQKTRREGLARLDYTQNAINKTLVAPYSTRPAPGAPVSAPISWDELDDPELRSDRWTVSTLPARLSKVGDLFEPLSGYEQPLPRL